ncbi:hypothetical protein [Vibrio owensii]|uniref:hypothetical protein n=1 Tax=Vibrio owensii TaxID=696485 RepID=UPI0018F1C04F|nr:hypothetical protein [Vibrio owensii]
MFRNELAWRAVLSNLRAYYIHNVFHDHQNHFGKGDSSDSVMLVVKAIDAGINLDEIFSKVHDVCEGVAFINDKATRHAIKMLKEVVQL